MSEHKFQFGTEAATILSQDIVKSHPEFDAQGYVDEVTREVEGLELKDRVMRMTTALRTRLPSEYSAAVQVLVDSLGPEIQGQDGMFTEGWYLMPVARFVEEYGLEHPEISMAALNEITRRHTAEYAVRPYIEQHFEYSMEVLREWVKSDNHHVRRLVSEGTRPRLPWATKLKCFIESPALELLQPLQNDESLFVRKSVANHLNDISKDHPDLVIETSEKWLRDSPTENTHWIVNRGLRTLAKSEDQRVFSLLGYTGGEDIKLHDLSVAYKELKIGESQSFNFVLENKSNKNHQVIIKYAVHLVRKNGSTNTKVFELTSSPISANSKQSFTKKQSFKPVSVRKYYPGKHQIDIIVNGLVKGNFSFELLE